MQKTIKIKSEKRQSNHIVEIYEFDGKNITGGFFEKAAHRREDHYLFIVQERGESSIMLDFTQVLLNAESMLCIAPGQVHYPVAASKDTLAWLIAVDVHLLEDSSQTLINEHYFDYKSKSLDPKQTILLKQCINLIKELQENNILVKNNFQVELSLLRAFTGLFCSFFDEAGYTKLSRPLWLSSQFKLLLQTHFKNYKTVSDYAAFLHVSPAYLNEAVKTATGVTVSSWIKQVVLTEAKRLLFATDMSVKEIAFSIGYDDPAYFIRYFSKNTGTSPLVFRNNTLKSPV